MGICDPEIEVLCDQKGCNYSEKFSMTSLAGGGYDERNLKNDLKRAGWKMDGENFICPNCVEEKEQP